MTIRSNKADAKSSSVSPLIRLNDHRVPRASLVNRTHRIVRERALSESVRRSRVKSLWIPLSVCSALLIIISTGAWTVLAQNDLSPGTIPDASDQMLVFLLWFFPVSAAVLATVWLERSRTSSSSESME